MSRFAWRDLEGNDPAYFADVRPNPPLPREGPITSRIEGPWGVPWIDGLEDPDAFTGLGHTTPDPQIDRPDIGGVIGPGDYRGEYRTRGPVQAWSHEASGGLWGNQAVGRTMRFPANIPDRYDVNGVWVGDYRDSLAAQLSANRVGAFTDVNSIEDLLSWQGPESFPGWED